MGKRRQKKYPPLTLAQQRLVQDHRWIAGHLAFKANCATGGWTGMFTKEDLESVAYFALCVAASKFSPDRGIKFSTYAWVTARGYIMHALRDYSRMVRLPRWIPEYRQKLKVLLDDGVPYEKAIEILNIDDEKAALCELSWAEVHASYDHRPEGWREREFVYDHDEVRQIMSSPEISEALRSLTDGELDTLLKYVDDAPLTEEERTYSSDKIEELRSLVYGSPTRKEASA